MIDRRPGPSARLQIRHDAAEALLMVHFAGDRNQPALAAHPGVWDGEAIQKVIEVLAVKGVDITAIELIECALDFICVRHTRLLSCRPILFRMKGFSQTAAASARVGPPPGLLDASRAPLPPSWSRACSPAHKAGNT